MGAGVKHGEGGEGREMEGGGGDVVLYCNVYLLGFKDIFSFGSLLWGVCMSWGNIIQFILLLERVR